MKQYLSTEIRIAPDEFDEYVIEQGPVQLAFPLREFRVRREGLYAQPGC